MKANRIVLATALVLAAGGAWADDDCEVAVGQWQPRAAVLQLAAQQGWQVQRLKVDDGCYELRGRDAQGRSFKAKLDPQTLRVLKMKTRDDDAHHEHDRARSRTRTPAAASGTASAEAGAPTGAGAAAAASAAVPAAKPGLVPGTTPRASIE